MEHICFWSLFFFTKSCWLVVGCWASRSKYFMHIQD